MRVYLKGNPEAEDFSNLLLQIGNGDLHEDDDRKVNIPNNLCAVVKDLKSLIEQIYPNLNNLNSVNLTWLNERAILTPKNDTAASINDSLLDQLPTEMVKYSSVDSVMELEDVVNYPVEFLHTLNPPEIPAHNLCLKIGTPNMLLRNLIPPKLRNGTRLRVKTFVAATHCCFDYYAICKTARRRRPVFISLPLPRPHLTIPRYRYVIYNHLYKLIY